MRLKGEHISQVCDLPDAFYTTEKSEIFARVYFRETSHMRSFVKIKSSRNGEITVIY